MQADPLEPLRDVLQILNNWEKQHREWLKRLQDLGMSLDGTLRGKVGAVVAEVEEMRKSNQMVLNATIDQAERELRQEIEHQAANLLKVINDMMRIARTGR